jgi:2-polyprenyl-3-methyl-5-hydroxy-6-metoxy-1,4-benzoquinol methylase
MSDHRWPWTWEDSACTRYLREDAVHFEAIQGSGWAPKRLLMLGCGDGTSMNAMARRNPGCQFVGVDMNSDYIRKAKADAPDNAHYRRFRFHELDNDQDSFDTVLMVGVIGCVSQLDAIAAFVAAGLNLINDGRLVFNFPNKMIFAERMIYRDAIINCGRDKNAALRAVQMIAAHHPSETVRKFGRDIVSNVSDDQEHFLFAPEFLPYYEWDMENTLGRYDFKLLQSSASPFALGESITYIIKSSSRWHIYGRKQMHDH